MVHMKIGEAEFTIKEGKIESKNANVQKFFEDAIAYYYPQPKHQDDPDLALSDFFEAVTEAKVTKYDIPATLKKAYEDGVIL